ncbi:DUF6786 family protein [Candidatus Neomarinimicrobiota bacterium]
MTDYTVFLRNGCVCIVMLILTGCYQPGSVSSSVSTDSEVSTLKEDMEFLQRYGPLQILEGSNGSRVVLSAQYQGRVMTSAVDYNGASLGWINRLFITSRQTGSQFDNYGGEDRFWLGPEGGQYGLYFRKGSPFEFSHWQVPGGLQENSWTIQKQSATSVTYNHPVEVTNYTGTTFNIEVERTVRLLSVEEIEQKMGITLPEALKWVGFATENRVTNTGQKGWMKADGLLSIWILSMLNPFGETYVVVPFDPAASGEVVNDAYFGKVPPDRLDVRNDYLIFKCDGEYRSKIGLGSERALAMLGSYNVSLGLLTLVQFDKPEGATDYVNSMWELQEKPYSGDVINSYNDGPTEPGKPTLGGFYELETSSPALTLSPGESYTHIQRTLHLIGGPTALDPVARAVLGISLSEIADEAE